MSRGRIVVLYGTRPEALKVGPVVHELRQFGVEPTIITTGQHTTLLDGCPAKRDLSGAMSLNLPSSGEVVDWVGRGVLSVQAALESLRPIAAVVVQGDTMSAYAGAFAAARAKIPIAHIEAGLRSGSDQEPWPEEVIRKAIAQKADWHYCPTPGARDNLLTENVPEDRIFVTGNTIVSALHRYTSVKPAQVPSQQVLVTMHRREWVGMGRDFVRLTIDAFLDVAEDYPDIRFLWPMHPNVLKTGDIDPRNTPPNVLISPPLAYEEAMTQLASSIGVATDSGGLQEEAGTLGVPCAVLRNTTDRPESEALGMAQRFPPTANGMIEAVRWLIEDDTLRIPLTVYGNAQSARRIAEHLRTLV